MNVPYGNPHGPIVDCCTLHFSIPYTHVHFRLKQIKLTNCQFNVGNENLDIVSDYKYLGFYLDEFLQYKVGINN